MTAILQPLPDVYSAGQPSAEQLGTLACDGVRTVINLRAPGEPAAFDEALEAGRLGLRYVAIPVAGADDITPATVKRFSRELAQARDAGDVLVHCGSANRAGALLALDRGFTGGLPPGEALSIGRAAGMTTLEPRVSELLARGPEVAATTAAPGKH
ncbi:MAG: protein tyrosine phosphatase family protein [Pseudomonadota bacterium]|nr:protein tyrosine phosphatase family protein [Pseudomonadota bacterium]